MKTSCSTLRASRAEHLPSRACAGDILYTTSAVLPAVSIAAAVAAGEAPAAIQPYLSEIKRRAAAYRDAGYVVINAASIETGKPIDEITAKYMQAYNEDMAALGVLPPDVEPRATQHIDDMIAMIQALIDAGHAYEADGHVLFDGDCYADYGALSKRDLREMIAEIASASQSVAESASKQAASIEETSASLEELTAMAAQNSDHAHQADQLMTEAIRQTQNASQTMERLSEAMHTISGLSTKIAHIVDTIDEIASASKEQTNGIRQINMAVTEMDKSTQQNAATAEQLSASTGNFIVR